MQYFPVLVYRTQPLTHWHKADVTFPLYSSLVLFLSAPDPFAQGNISRSHVILYH